MQNNHLIEPIQCILEAADGPLSEYALMSQLQVQQWLEPIDANNSVSLYSAHFLVYNALFQLHSDYLKTQQHLTISALHIALEDRKPSTESAALHVHNKDNQADIDSLRDYYLDWENLETATKDSVEQLLTSFWERFVSDDDYIKAAAILAVTDNSSEINYAQVKTAYRKLAMTHHPDRGGDIARFQDIQWAFAVFQQHFKGQ